MLAANRVFINTLEQYALLFAASAALVMHIPVVHAGALPALYITWTLARVVYAVGYVHGKGPARMLGFPATVMPTAAALGYAVYLIFTTRALF